MPIGYRGSEPSSDQAQDKPKGFGLVKMGNAKTAPSEKNKSAVSAAYQELVNEAKTFIEKPDLEIIEKAYRFAEKHHEGQTRQSGEPYITHPLEVARIVCTLKLDVASVVAAILHDTVEDTDCTLNGIEAAFGQEVCTLVNGLTKIGKIKFQSKQERLAENFRKMILAMAKDLRVILIKLCDRLHNLRTIGSLPAIKRRRIAQETLDIYAPLANRLGIYGIKSELEDLCLRELKKEIYQEIREKIASKKSERQSYIEEVKSILEHELKKYGFKDIVVYGRPKHFFSIYKKMVERHLEFEDIHDLFAFRIIVNSIKDCYEALGVVHAMWKPMPGRFKDYIAMPKANMYQSLHTTVVRPNGEPAEIQIRTRDMHRTSEYGVAAHWAYKETKDNNLGGTDLDKFSWLRQIVQWQSELKDPDEFLEAVKVDLFDEEIFVFTPKGDVFSLPQKATALDFAFAVHTDIGLKTIGSKVNGRMVPIKKELQSGDIVEVLTSNNQKPSKDWLTFVTTSKARNKIRSFLRSEQREKSRRIGIEFLSRELEKIGVDISDFGKTSEKEKVAKLARESTYDDVLISIGYGKIRAEELVKKLFPEAPKNESIEKQVETAGLPTQISKSKSRSQKGILVSGHDDVLVNIGRCCSPLPGEKIIGFITRGRGVTIHRTDCARALDMDPVRRIDVEWGDELPEMGNAHRCLISVVTHDKPGVLAEVTSKIASTGVNILKAEAKVSPDLVGRLEFELGLKNLVQLEKVIQLLEQIPAVMEVQRKINLKNKKQKKNR